MNDLLHDSTDVAIAFSVVKWTKLGGILVEVSVRLELDGKTSRK